MIYSANYDRAVAEATAHHLSSKTYSGMFLRPHAAPIKKLIDELKVTSILDWGCGKGKQYQWVSHDDSTGVPKGQTLEQFWGIEVYRYDPAWPPFAELPLGKFDMVICTHVLGCIPMTDIQDFKRDMYWHALKVVYLAEKLAPPHKRVYTDAHKMARFYTHDQYADLMKPHGRPALDVWLTTREPGDPPIVKVSRL